MDDFLFFTSTVILGIFAVVMTLLVVWSVISAIVEELLFKKGRNPFHRICKKCGQHQIQYTFSYNRNYTWWEEVYPLGNVKSCSCSKYTEYHD